MPGRVWVGDPTHTTLPGSPNHPSPQERMEGQAVCTGEGARTNPGLCPSLTTRPGVIITLIALFTH